MACHYVIVYCRCNPKPYTQMTCLQISHFFWITGILTLILSAATGMKRIFVKNPNEVNVLKAIHVYKVISFEKSV